jgi:hypothetical protein
MITKFNNYFESLKIGNGSADWVYGFHLNKNEFTINIEQIFKFLKEKNIEYVIYHHSDTDTTNDYFIILFPNLRKLNPVKGYMQDNKKEKKKFTKNEWDDDKVYLPIKDENNEISHGFTLKPVYADHIEDCKEIIINNINDLDMAIIANKYNL